MVDGVASRAWRVEVSIMREQTTKEFAETRASINAAVLALLGTSPKRIYEAGGGSGTVLISNLTQNAHITVVDLSPEQVDRCTYASEAIVGNIETWRRPDAFDLIVCSNVLEHIDDVGSTLENFAGSLAAGGVCVIIGPVPTSLQGWVTRLTPHRFHVWYYRYIKKKKTAGLPGYAPFPVVYASGSHDVEMGRRLGESGLEMRHAIRYVGRHAQKLRRENKFLYLGYWGACTIARLTSFGLYDPRFTDFVLVAQKPVVGGD